MKKKEEPLIHIVFIQLEKDPHNSKRKLVDVPYDIVALLRLL